MRSIWLAAGIVMAAVAVVMLHDVLMTFFAAAVFAVPLRAGALAIARSLRVPAVAGLILLLVGLGLAAAATVWAWEVMLAAQVSQLAVRLPSAAAAVSRPCLPLRNADCRSEGIAHGRCCRPSPECSQ